MEREERPQAETTEEIVDRGRRGAMKKIAVGVGVLAGCSVLPEKWTRPIIGQIVLPAHAATSGSTLHDPCAVELRGGDNTTASVIVKVTGFVTPPVANVPVTVTATAVGGAGLKVESKTTTSAAGTFEVFMTIGGGPGITSVNVSTSATGADGVANCVVHTTGSAGGPATTVQYFRGPVPDGGDLCVAVTGGSATFYAFDSDPNRPDKYITGTGPANTSITGNINQGGGTEPDGTTITVTGINNLGSSGGTVTMAGSDNEGHQGSASVILSPQSSGCI